MSGNSSTMLAFEKRFNPVLAMDREAIVETLADDPPIPFDMNTIIQFNPGRKLQQIA